MMANTSFAIEFVNWNIHFAHMCEREEGVGGGGGEVVRG